MASIPSLLCWQGKHKIMAALGVAGIVCYPICILSVVVWITWNFPSRIASGRSIVLVQRCKWLFNRLRAERYYFGSSYLLRGALLSLVPVAFPAGHVQQVLAFSFLLVAYVGLQGLLWPWRTQEANAVDLCVNLGLTFLAVGAGCLVPTRTQVDEGTDRQSVQVFVSIGLLLALTSVAAVVLVSACRRLHPLVLYSAFLCHHKVAAGALCRYMQCMLTADFPRIFLDSDNLLELDLTFEIVRASTETHVAIGTPDVFRRMWCAGEITTALANNIRVVIVMCDDYMHPDEAYLNVLESAWSAEEVHTLASFGLVLPRIKDAYRQLRSRSAIQ